MRQLKNANYNWFEVNNIFVTHKHTDHFLGISKKYRKAQERPVKEWLIPANPKYYDILHAFDEKDEIDWKQWYHCRRYGIYVCRCSHFGILYRCKVNIHEIMP